MTRHCRKRPHASLRLAETGAHVYARKLNQSGRIAEDLYAYRCKACRAWHLTRHAEHEGAQNKLVFTAPPEALQRWAING